MSGLWRGACPLVVRGALLAAGQMLGYDGLKTYCKRSACADDQSVFCYVPCGCFAVLANRSWQVYPDWLRTAIAHLFNINDIINDETVRILLISLLLLLIF
eukprot:COSAG06_NODE_27291_length_596_cov_1.008048_1_plen_100_part_10